jgi:hypothetical protein
VILALVSVISSESTTEVPRFCKAVLSHPVLATKYINQLLAAVEANKNAPKTFKTTITYVTTKKGELTTSVKICEQFFVGLRTPLLTDLKATGLSPKAAKSRLTELIDGFIKKLLAKQA